MFGWIGRLLRGGSSPARAFLEEVGRAASIDGALIFREDDDMVLRAQLGAMTLRINRGIDEERLGLELVFAENGTGYWSLEHDPAGTIDTEGKTTLAPHIHASGFEVDAAEFFAQLPAALQARVLRDVPRLGISHVASDPDRASVSFLAVPAAKDVVEALAVIIAITKARSK